MHTRIGRLGLVVLLAGMPVLAGAQDAPTTAAPATLAYIEGGVDLDHEGVAESASAPTLLLEGDRVRTRDGRAEIVLADGSLLHVDHHTTVEWLGGAHIRLLDGRVMARLSPSAAPYTVDTPPGAVRLQPRGEYDLRLGSQGSDLELSVVRGVAELDAPGDRLLVRGGETLVAAASGRTALRRFNSARFDAFTSWAYQRASGSSYGDSSRYLPAPLRAYGSSLDRHGRWDYADAYGYVWYPSVSVGWRPYSHGGWRHTRYGWTWYGLDAWAWPTHHFGRWGFSGNAWFWVPGAVWGPAWVSWAFAPGYVGWSPLGWDGHRGANTRGRHGRGGYDPWHSWTAIPRNRFGQRGAVQSWIVNARELPDTSRGAFVFQAAPPPSPAGRGSAVPRGSFAVAGSGPRSTPGPAHQDVQPGAVPRYASPSGSWTPSNGAAASPNSWSRPIPGSARRPEGAPPQAPPIVGSTTPAMGETSPTVIPGRPDAPGDAQYAIPRRSPESSDRREDAEIFRGGTRAPQASPRSDGQSWTPRERPDADGRSSAGRSSDGANRSDGPARQGQSYEGAGRSGGARHPGRAGRAPEGSSGSSASPPPSSRPSEGAGGSRGAVRRPPPR